MYAASPVCLNGFCLVLFQTHLVDRLSDGTGKLGLTNKTVVIFSSQEGDICASCYLLLLGLITEILLSFP